MPTRMIRDGILDSERYWAVSNEAQLLFIHLLLLADDFGLVGLAPVFIKRRCFDTPPSEARLQRLLQQLQDADLIRIYVASEKSHAFIPRFGQRMRQLRARNPRPPKELYRDDRHATDLFNENAHLFERMTATCPQPAGALQPEVKGKGIGSESEARRIPGPAPGSTAHEWAKHLGLTQGSGEHEGAFQARIAKAVAEYKALPRDAQHEPHDDAQWGLRAKSG